MFMTVLGHMTTYGYWPSVIAIDRFDQNDRGASRFNRSPSKRHLVRLVH
jgi:hypothetical protein